MADLFKRRWRSVQGLGTTGPSMATMSYYAGRWKKWTQVEWNQRLKQLGMRSVRSGQHGNPELTRHWQKRNISTILRRRNFATARKW